MANPVKGEVPLDIGGQRYILVLNTYALAAVERRMGMPWTKLFQQASEGGWGVATALATFHASLQRHHKTITEEQAAELIDVVGLERVNEAIVEALNLMMPGGQGAPNPPQAQAQTGTVPTNGTGTSGSPPGSL